MTNIQTFLLNFSLDIGPRSDTLYLDVTIQEGAKFNVFLMILVFPEKDLHFIIYKNIE